MKQNLKSLLVAALCIAVLVLFFFQNHAIAQDKVKKIDEFVQIHHDYGIFSGTVLVAWKGKVIFKKGYGMANIEWNIHNKPNTKFRIGSITKQFTSMLIMQLVEKGKIDLEGKLVDYLPYYRKDTGEKVTIHQLLTHMSGIPSYTSMPNFFEEISRDPYPVKEFIQKYCSGDLEFEPGAKFSYNNSGYFILGAVIEEVTGKTYEEVLKEKILDPLGMKGTGYDHHDTIIKNRATGYRKTLDGYENSPYLDMSLPYAAGSLYSTVEDLYLWDQALYTEKLLSKKMKDLMFKVYSSARGQGYGYGWFIGEKKLPESEEKLNKISHGGGINGFNTLIERYIDDRHLVVLFNNAPRAPLGRMSDAIIKILYDKPYEKNLPKKSIAEVIYKTYKGKGVEAAIKQYQELKEKHPKEYNFAPNEINMLGYYLLDRKKNIKDAIEILKFNVKVNPKYANGYDSLAEAYMKNGDKLLAIKNYAKSLELNPKNTGAVDKLKELMKEK
ncbi:MAG: serine hydrolase [Candidatus Aminicenantes bacterium]|nr:MAG: serine hydrolase [Candidatus Aminicenantes bacterium]